MRMPETATLSMNGAIVSDDALQNVGMSLRKIGLLQAAVAMNKHVVWQTRFKGHDVCHQQMHLSFWEGSMAAQSHWPEHQWALLNCLTAACSTSC